MVTALNRLLLLILPLAMIWSPVVSAQPAQRKSLRPGITQTQRELNRLDDAIQAGINDDLILLVKSAGDLVPGGALAQLLHFDQHIGLSKAISSKDYAQAVANALEEIIGLFGENIRNNLPDYLGNAISKGVPVIDAASDAWELYLVLRERAQMIETRDKLFQQLLRLQSKDPQTIAEWGNLLRNLHGDPEAEHHVFLKWLKNQKIDEGQVIQRVLKNAQSSNSAITRHAATGLAIVDPQQGIETATGSLCLNPDFVSALRKQQQLLSQGKVNTAMMADKYSNGKYIPVFGGHDCAKPNRVHAMGPEPRGDLSSIDFLELIPEVADKMGIACCNFSHDPDVVHQVIAEIDRQIESGRPVTWDGQAIRPGQAVIRETYKENQWSKRSGSYVETTPGNGDLTFIIPQGDQNHLRWSWVTALIDIDKCIDTLSRAGSSLYTAHCEADYSGVKLVKDATVQLENGHLRGRVIEKQGPSTTEYQFSGDRTSIAIACCKQH